jgi:acyl-CoA thioesterase FadM
MGNSSVVFGYHIRRKRDGVLCFQARVTTVLVSIDTMKPVKLDAEYRSLFERLLSAKK